MHRKNWILIKKSKLIKVLTARQVRWEPILMAKDCARMGLQKDDSGGEKRMKGWKKLVGGADKRLIACKSTVHASGQTEKYLLARWKATWKWWVNVENFFTLLEGVSSGKRKRVRKRHYKSFHVRTFWFVMWVKLKSW